MCICAQYIYLSPFLQNLLTSGEQLRFVGTPKDTNVGIATCKFGGMKGYWFTPKWVSFFYIIHGISQLVTMRDIVEPIDVIVVDCCSIPPIVDDEQYPSIFSYHSMGESFSLYPTKIPNPSSNGAWLSLVGGFSR